MQTQNLQEWGFKPFFPLKYARTGNCARMVFRHEVFFLSQFFFERWDFLFSSLSFPHPPLLFILINYADTKFARMGVYTQNLKYARMGNCARMVFRHGIFLSVKFFFWKMGVECMSSSHQFMNWMHLYLLTTTTSTFNIYSKLCIYLNGPASEFQ